MRWLASILLCTGLVACDVDPSERGTQVRVTRYERGGVSAVYVSRNRVPGYDEPLPAWKHLPSWTDLADPGPAYAAGTIDREDRGTHAAGWPLRAMRFGVTHDTSTWAPQFIDGFDTGRPWPAPRRGAVLYPKMLPLRPIWPGFVANSILYGVTIGMLLFGWRRLRRGIRRHRGRCPACGYPAGQSPQCSECGVSLEPVALRSPKASRDHALRV